MVDYWERYQAQPDLGEAERDQPRLRAVDAAIKGELDRVIRWLSNPITADRVERFGASLSTQIVLQILMSSIDAAGAAFSSSRGEGPPGLVNVWRMLLRRSERNAWQPGPLAAGFCGGVNT